MHTGARARKQNYISIYISLYMKTRFQKGFHVERYIDRYILLFSCTCARAHFSLLIVQLVKKLASTINSLLVRFFVPICQYKREWTNIVCNSLDLHSFENQRMRNAEFGQLQVIQLLYLQGKDERFSKPLIFFF